MLAILLARRSKYSRQSKSCKFSKQATIVIRLDLSILFHVPIFRILLNDKSKRFSETKCSKPRMSLILNTNSDTETNDKRNSIPHCDLRITLLRKSIDLNLI